MSVLYEKGTPAWDVGIILTRHSTSLIRPPACARARALELSAGDPDTHRRLREALLIGCTCGKGDSSAESTSLR